MLNRFFIAFVILFSVFSFSDVLLAQTEQKNIIRDAKIWTSSGDTTQCDILYLNQFSLQFSLVSVDTAGNPITHYSPKDIAGFSYKISKEVVEFISMPNPEDMGRIFLRLVYRGEMILYQYLEVNYKSTVLSFLVSYYIWKDEWLHPPLTQTYERESLLYYFSDCPELEYKIKTSQYGLIHIREIFSEYENCKLTDTYEFFYE